MLRRYKVVFPLPPKHDPSLVAMFPWAYSPGGAVQWVRRLIGVLPSGTFARLDDEDVGYQHTVRASDYYGEALR